MRKIAIVGSSTGNDKAPFNDPSWEIWSLNNLYTGLQGKRFTRWFELHDFNMSISADGLYTRRGVDQYSGTTIDKYMKEIASLNIPVSLR